jgi:hypothetical protein
VSHIQSDYGAYIGKDKMLHFIAKCTLLRALFSERQLCYQSDQSMSTDKKKYNIFLIYKEIQSGAVAKSFMRKGFLIYEEMRIYFPIYEEAVGHI